MQGVLRIELSGLNKNDLEGASRASHRAEEAQAERTRERENSGRKLSQLCSKHIPTEQTRKGVVSESRSSKANREQEPLLCSSELTGMPSKSLVRQKEICGLLRPWLRKKQGEEPRRTGTLETFESNRNHRQTIASPSLSTCPDSTAP